MSMLQNVTDATQAETIVEDGKGRKRRRAGQPPTPADPQTGQTGGSLTRVTANFTPRAIASLERVSSNTGDSRTDVLNMAVMAYEAILDLIHDGDGRTLRVQMPNGEVRVLQFIG